MSAYRLHRTQVLPITPAQAWLFFSSPANLGKITPARMNFVILSQSGGETMFEGQVIKYRITVLPLIRLTWVTKITGVTKPWCFTDEQVSGPYALWVHTHSFREVPGGVEMTDDLTYELPFGWLGRVAHWLFVGREVNRIFDHRFRVLEGYFSQP